MSGQFHGPAALPQGNFPWYPLDRRLSGRQSRSGRSGEEINLVTSGIQTLAVQPVARRYTD
jgi:hypothetical protein